MYGLSIQGGHPAFARLRVLSTVVKVEQYPLWRPTSQLGVPIPSTELFMSPAWHPHWGTARHHTQDDTEHPKATQLLTLSGS